MKISLTQYVARWRHDLARRAAFDDAHLDELEAHLWDEIERLQADGLDERQAFLRATVRLGHADALAHEFHKATVWGERPRWQHPFWQLAMLKNHLIVAGRQLRRYAGYTALNLLGLATGLAACLLIFLFVQHEASYDRFHDRAEDIYRVERLVQTAGNTGRYAFTSGPTGPAMEEAFPEVQAAARFFRQESLVRRGAQQFYGEQVVYTDPGFFEVFSFPLLRGDPATALTAPHQIVLTVSMAEKYFGSADPLGQTVRLDNDADYEVTGLLADVPDNSHYTFDALASFSTLLPRYSWLENWGSIGVQTYVRVQPGTPADALEAKFAPFAAQHIDYYDAARLLAPDVPPEQFLLKPITDIHLRSEVFEVVPQGDLDAVRLFMLIAVFILLLAVINYVNLTTAKAMNRFKEVGMRKVLGAERRQLVLQFLGESVLLVLLAFGGALVLAALALPWLNDFLGRSLSLATLAQPTTLGVTGSALLGIGLLAGGYPALYLSRLRPALVLKGARQSTRSALRRTLVVAQFTVAIVLLIGTLTLHDQLQFLQTMNLGFDQEHVVELPIRDAAALDRAEVLRARLQAEPQVAQASLSSSSVGAASRSGGMGPAQQDAARVLTDFLFVDSTFVETLGLTLVAGRNLRVSGADDAAPEVLITEVAAQRYGWANPVDAVGAWLSPSAQSSNRFQVVGIVEDLHINALRNQVRPAMLIPVRLPDDAVLSVRLQPGNVQEALATLESHWAALLPDWPFEYQFLDQSIAQRLRTDRQQGQLLGVLAGLAIFIACLGLFGLAAFMAARRTKEIGIRKVLGASLASIIGLLSREFVVLIGGAFVGAVPVAYFALQHWLEGFAYHTSLTASVFLLAGGLTLALALATVSYQAIRAARADPVQSLRYE